MGVGNAITESVFEEVLKERIPAHWERALELFTDYGPLYSFDITNVLMHAADQGKEEEILRALEEHWKEDISFEAPDLRDVGVRLSTMQLFHELCTSTLGLQPLPV